MSIPVQIVKVQYQAVPGVPSKTVKVIKTKARKDHSLKDEDLSKALRTWISGDGRVPFEFDHPPEQATRLERFKRGLTETHCFLLCYTYIK